HKGNGDCVYLGESGCERHASAPQLCREMDCRLLYQKLKFTEARRAGVLPVWRRGRELSE
ncbi:MAG: hypothetical protein WBG92_06280, partial [Thiohalocapsa sp.]